jgi:hypothetical protein
MTAQTNSHGFTSPHTSMSWGYAFEGSCRIGAPRVGCPATKRLWAVVGKHEGLDAKHRTKAGQRKVIHPVVTE